MAKKTFYMYSRSNLGPVSQLTFAGSANVLKRLSKLEVLWKSSSEMMLEREIDIRRTFQMASWSEPSLWIPASSESRNTEARRRTPLIIKYIICHQCYRPDFFITDEEANIS
jgi:hypothetical protein